MVTPWVECPTIDVDLDTKLGRRFQGMPESVVTLGRDLLTAVMQEIPQDARYLADAVRLRTANRFHQEMVALSRLVGSDWRDLMLANISYDLALAIFGCSTVALATSEGPVVARNMDWWPERVLARSSCLVRFLQNDQVRFANAGWPGAVGVVTGLSGRGFTVVLNAVMAPDEGVNKTGYPVLLHLRRVLEDAQSFHEALHMLSQQRLATSALITLVGSENAERVVVERSPTKCALRWAKDDSTALITTNDYRLLYRPETHPSLEIYRTTCNRYDYLSDFFANHQSTQPVEDAKLLYALTDDKVMQTITAQHILMRPRTGDVKMYAPRYLVNEST